MAPHPGHHGTPYKNPYSSRSLPDLPGENCAKSAEDKIDVSKRVVHPSHKPFPKENDGKRIDGDTVRSGVAELKARYGLEQEAIANE